MAYWLTKECMNVASLQIIEPTLQAFPVALIFSKHLLLPQESSFAVHAGSPDAATELLPIDPVRLTLLPKDFGGYSHGGINE